MAFSPTGGRLVTGGLRGTISIWNVASGARTADLSGASALIMDIAFSPDSSTLAVAGFDRAVHLFDVKSTTERLVLQHDVVVSAVAFSPDGSRLASFTPGQVRVWALDVDNLLRIAGEQVTRTLTALECRQYLHVDACP
jgi:WD40 repeat protein